MRHGSLFSGIGGFDLAAEWMGWENIFHCEWNPFGQKVLKHHFPNSISYNDITKTDFSIHEGDIDILTGGFPYQPYSSAGKQLGKADERHLFPEMLRAIKEIKPTWIIGENVRGLVSWNGGMVFHEVHDDLERQGYEVQSFLIPAAGVNAPHQRYRIWFVAYSNNNGTRSRLRKIQSENGEVPKWNNYAEFGNTDISNVTNSLCKGLQWSKELRSTKKSWSESNQQSARLFRTKWEKFPTESPVCRRDDGISKRLDSITFPKWRIESIKAYGNAIVPQVAHHIFKTIESFENSL
jgi:DNA (cytosine-5)-methyltransferase 1